jgi:hypothetical protein
MPPLQRFISIVLGSLIFVVCSQQQACIHLRIVKGKALRQVLEAYDISQNKLVTMGVDQATVNRWVYEQRDPAGDVIVEIKDALRQVNPLAAEEFIKLYLGDPLDGEN